MDSTVHGLYEGLTRTRLGTCTGQDLVVVAPMPTSHTGPALDGQRHLIAGTQGCTRLLDTTALPWPFCLLVYATVVTLLLHGP